MPAAELSDGAVIFIFMELCVTSVILSVFNPAWVLSDQIKEIENTITRMKTALPMTGIRVMPIRGNENARVNNRFKFK